VTLEVRSFAEEDIAGAAAPGGAAMYATGLLTG
jgi:hypothetical protein